MHRRPLLIPTTLAFALVTACGGDAKKDAKADAKDAKVDAKAAPDAGDSKRNDATSLDREVKALDLSGPVPPEASAVFFTVDGALIPIGCYDKDRKKLAGGKDCLKLAKAGDEVYVKSASVEKLDKIGGPKSAMCQPGEDKPTSFGIPAVDAGETFEYAVFPKSLAPLVKKVEEATWGEAGRVASAEEKAALVAVAKVEGELQIHQSVTFDVDGDGQPDKLISAYQVNPKDSERFSYSAVFLQRGNAPGKWVPVQEERNTVETYTVRAFLDLDADRSQELWVNAVTTEGGGGDRIIRLTASGGEPLSKWSCGI